MTKEMWEKHPDLDLQLGGKVCDGCRKQLDRRSYLEEYQPSSPSISDYEDVSIDETEQPPLQIVSDCLEKLGETPIDRRKASRSKKYSKQKVAKITALMDKVVLGEEKPQDEAEIIHQLKYKFHRTTKRSVKIQILTVLPMSWSIDRIQTEFGASNFMVRKAKQLVKQHGILSSPNPQPGRPNLTEKVIDTVKSFYESDSSSTRKKGLCVDKN